MVMDFGPEPRSGIAEKAPAEKVSQAGATHLFPDSVFCTCL